MKHTLNHKHELKITVTSCLNIDLCQEENSYKTGG